MEKCTSQKKAGGGILIPDKVDLRAKNITTDKEGLPYEEKEVNSSRGHNNPKWLCPY